MYILAISLFVTKLHNKTCAHIAVHYFEHCLPCMPCALGNVMGMTSWLCLVLASSCCQAAVHRFHINDCETVALKPEEGLHTDNKCTTKYIIKTLVPITLGDLTWAESCIKVIITVFHRFILHLIIQILKHFTLTFHLDSISNWHHNYFLSFHFRVILQKQDSLVYTDHTCSSLWLRLFMHNTGSVHCKKLC